MTDPRFVRVEIDPKLRGRSWRLGAPRSLGGEEIDPRVFTKGRHVDYGSPLQVVTEDAGRQLGFNLAAFDMVVSATALNDELERLTGENLLQRIPAIIDEGDFEILNVCDRVACFDVERSQFTRWTETDGRPDKVGQLRMVTELRVRPRSAFGHHLFRVDEWPIALVVSEEAKAILENFDAAGVSFVSV